MSVSPNILWICADQQRFDTLGCYGNALVHTPHIDELAARGVLFEQCFVQSPVCSPSRAAMLTGRYPRTTRLRQNGQMIPNDERLVPRILADHGYVCGLSGKLHLAACDPSVCDVEARIDDGYTTFHWSHHPDWSHYSDPARETNDYIRWLTSQGETYHREFFQGSRYVQTAMPSALHQTTWCADRAIDFINSDAAREQPWLFSVNMFDPHHPFDPPADLLERYLDRLDDIPLPNYVEGELQHKSIFQQKDHHGAYNTPGAYPASKMTDHDHRLIRAAYYAMVDLIDQQVGRMLAALDDTEQRSNTLVIYMSDHGEMLGDHGVYLKGPHLYEPAIHVPLIMAGPRVRSGVRYPELVELADIAPTLLDAAGVEPPPGMQTRSFWPALTGDAGAGEALAPREDVYCEFYHAVRTYDPKAYATMVRTNQHKLIVYHGLDFGELYDLSVDPDEQHNLWHDAQAMPVRMRMLQRLCDRMAQTVDPLPVRDGPW